MFSVSATRLFVSTLCVLFLAASATSLDPAFIKANGYLLRNNAGQGEPIYLRGVNIGGWLVQEAWMCPSNSSGNMWQDAIEHQLVSRFGVSTKNSLIATYQDNWITTTDLDYMRDMGMNMVRLPFSYLTFMEEEASSVPLANIAWKSNAFQRLDWFIQQAKIRKIYTLLDFHEVQGGAVDPGPNPNSFWAVSAYQDRAVEIWKRIAARYANESWVVGYDLLNEPWSTAVSYYDRVIKAIRPIDPHHSIFVETWGWSNLPNMTAYNWTNAILSLHYYPGGQGRPSDPDVALQQLLSEVATSRASSGYNLLPIHIGEFYINGGTDQHWRSMYDAFLSHDLPFNKWTWKTHYVSGWGAYNRGHVPTWDSLPRGSFVPNLFDPATTSTSISTMWSAWSTVPYTENDFSHLDGFNRAFMSSPVPKNDTVTVPASGTVVILDQLILQNDYSANPNADIRLVEIKSSSLGAFTRMPQGYVFVANVGASGTEDVFYNIHDNNNNMPGSWPGVISLRVPTPSTSVAPYGVPDTYATTMGSPLRVLSPGVLFNDGDTASRPITAVISQQAQNGAVELNSDGSFLYTPSTTFSGRDQFQYRVLASSASSEIVTVSINVVARVPTNSGGLTAMFFNTTGFSSNYLGNRTDATVDFTWPSGSAPLPNMSPINFAIRWTGSICPQVSGNHSLIATSDDAIRVYLNGSSAPTLDDWNAHGARDVSNFVIFQAGICQEIRIDFIQYGGGAVAQLWWIPPGGSKVIVPSTALVPNLTPVFPPATEIIVNPSAPVSSPSISAPPRGAPSAVATPAVSGSPKSGSSNPNSATGAPSSNTAGNSSTASSLATPLPILLCASVLIFLQVSMFT